MVKKKFVPSNSIVPASGVVLTVPLVNLIGAVDAVAVPVILNVYIKITTIKGHNPRLGRC